MPIDRVKQLGGQELLENHYNNSLSEGKLSFLSCNLYCEALKYIYPDYKWDRRKFRNEPNNDLRHSLQQLAKQLRSFDRRSVTVDDD